jgi:ribonuclease E
MASSDEQFPADEATQGASEASAAAGAPAEQATPADEPAPARKRAPRRATKKAAAPAPAAPPVVETGGGSGGAPGEQATATAEPEAGAAGSPDAGEAGSEAGPAEAPRRRAAKKTAKKTTKRAAKKAAPAAEPAEAAASVPETGGAPEVTGEPVTSAAAATDAELEDLAEQATEPAADAPAEPVAPGFGLLFQAPEPIAPEPRRRGRQAKARPEPEAAEDERDERDERGEGRADTGAERDAGAERAAGQAAEQPEGEEGGAESSRGRRRRSRGGKGRRGRGGSNGEEITDEGTESPETEAEAREQGGEDRGSEPGETEGEGEGGSRRRTRRRRRSGSAPEGEDAPGVVTKVREPRKERDEPQSVKGSTRLEAKKQRRREGREAGRRRTIITEAEFLARRESVERTMVVRERDGRTQIGVLEDGVLVEHYVSRETNASMAGNVYLGRVQNVLPSMEAAFVDIGKGRNAVLYAGEVNWDAAGLENNQPKRIENALKSGDTVLVQVTKDPIGHKGARLTSQISLPGRYLVYVPEGSMTGISRKLPDTERARLKQILKEVVPESAGVIVRTAAEGASEEELRADVERLTKTWERIRSKADAKSGSKAKSGGAPALVHGEPDLTVRVIRDVFNEDFTSLVVAGDQAWSEVSEYINDVAPDLAERLKKWTSEEDLFTHHRVDEQIAKAMDRKVWLPSGGSLVIDRTEAMTVVDVNTGKFVGSGGNLEETVTKNNIEAAEEIVRQLRLRDIGGIIVIDFIDMVLESNRDLVVRRLLECLGRDRTKHQVAEVTSLGLVQMTRKRVGSGLIEVFSESCDHCNGRGIIVHAEPVDKPSSGESGGGSAQQQQRSRSRRGKGGGEAQPSQAQPAPPAPSGPTPAQIAAAAHAAALKSTSGHGATHGEEAPAQDQPVLEVVEAEDQTPAGAEAAEARAAAPEVRTGEAPAGPVTEPAPAAPARASEPVAPAEPAPRRRKRGRVVAPAGPPKGGAGETPAATAEPAPATAP